MLPVHLPQDTPALNPAEPSGSEGPEAADPLDGCRSTPSRSAMQDAGRLGSECRLTASARCRSAVNPAHTTSLQGHLADQQQPLLRTILRASESWKAEHPCFSCARVYIILRFPGVTCVRDTKQHAMPALGLLALRLLRQCVATVI
jgi:hypothetical protein